MSGTAPIAVIRAGRVRTAGRDAPRLIPGGSCRGRMSGRHIWSVPRGDGRQVCGRSGHVADWPAVRSASSTSSMNTATHHSSDTGKFLMR